jgi:hypothetical protein
MSPFLLSLGSHSKQAAEKRHLSHAVSFFHATNWPFPHYVHDLLSLEGSPRCLKRKETSPRFDASFDARGDLVRRWCSGMSPVGGHTFLAALLWL